MKKGGSHRAAGVGFGDAAGGGCGGFQRGPERVVVVGAVAGGAGTTDGLADAKGEESDGDGGGAGASVVEGFAP